MIEAEGISIDIVSAERSSKELGAVLADIKRNMIVSPLISYDPHDKTQRFVLTDNSFTVKALYRLGFSWPLVNKNYIERSIDALITLGFFDDTSDEADMN